MPIRRPGCRLRVRWPRRHRDITKWTIEDSTSRPCACTNSSTVQVAVARSRDRSAFGHLPGWNRTLQRARSPKTRKPSTRRRVQYRMFGVSGTDRDARASSPIEIPEDIFTRVNSLCLTLPEVTVRVDASLTRARSTAHSFEIRRRSFCLLVAREGPTRKSVPLLVLRADPDERDALVSI